MNSVLLATPAAPRRTAPIRLGLIALLAGIVPAQTFWNWRQPQPALRPSARHGHCLVFDAARNVMLLFGGVNIAAPFNDTWTWNGTDWAQLQPVVVPPPRNHAGMAYDSARQRVVLFGGYSAGALGDTWTWDGATWIQRAPVHAPAPRYGFAMAYDVANARTVLFSGLNGNVSEDTWTWDGSDWTQLAPAHSPPGRYYMNMAYDVARARCVLFGGAGNPPWGDTWEWDGVDWARRLTTLSPGARAGAALAYDATRQRVVLFGGVTDPPWLSGNATWQYDGFDWVLDFPIVAPSAISNVVMAYDAGHANVLLFGGSAINGPDTDETWLYTPGTLASRFIPFGQGCLGSVGMPRLVLTAGLPMVGMKFEVMCTNLQPDHFTTMWLGFSNTNWFLGNLPYDLGALGMPGCTLFVSNDIVVPLLNWNGRAFWTMQVPYLPQLVGLPFYLQAGVIDHVNPLGMVVTNAAEVRIGDQ